VDGENVTDTGALKRIATEAPRRQGWAPTSAHQDRPPLQRNPLRVYLTRIIIWDTVAVIAAAAIGFILRWTIPYDLDISDTTYVLFAGIVVVSWIFALAMRGAYDIRVLGVGSEEFKRVVTASALLFGAVAIVAFAFKLDLSRGFVLITFVVGMILLLVDRWIARAWLRRERRFGQYLHQTLVIGHGERCDEIVDLLDRDPVAGFTVVDVVVDPDEATSDQDLDIWLDEVMARIDLQNIDTVAVAGSPSLGQRLIKRLAWRLEGPRVDLLVAPMISDFTGPRVTIRMQADLPLIHLDEPQLKGPKGLFKRAFDIIVGLLLCVIFLPFMLFAALGNLLFSRGPVFYRQHRIGQGGQLITVTKFRTMRVGADQEREEIIGDPDDRIRDRYRNDPRVTSFGRVLRRWSIDEMPQIINVIGGSMSLVGPRPVLIDEIPLFGDEDHRRHLTKPGLTGLWQVSGRKAIDWDERMRMDLEYVEHWSPAMDLIIMAKTVKVVITGAGAY
jgi:exopolysaccharide biosynthesis polyprenyl glycosylphosphotransferase